MLGGRTDLERAEAWAAHRCHPHTLATIDGMHGRGEVAVREWPTEARRLFEGLEMTEDEDDA